MKPIKLKFVDGRAETPFGTYWLIQQSARGRPAWVVDFDAERAIPAHFREQADAIAAAQRDFNERLGRCYE